MLESESEQINRKMVLNLTTLGWVRLLRVCNDVGRQTQGVAAWEGSKWGEGAHLRHQFGPVLTRILQIFPMVLNL